MDKNHVARKHEYILNHGKGTSKIEMQVLHMAQYHKNITSNPVHKKKFLWRSYQTIGFLQNGCLYDSDASDDVFVER